MWQFMVLCLLLVSSSIADINKNHNKYVTTLINAKWLETPLILEIAEYLNDESPDYFWRFVDAAVKAGDHSIYEGTEKEQYDKAIQLAAEFLSPTEIAVLKLSLSLRIYSARVEMFSQMAVNKPNIPDCRNFMDIGGRLTCSVERLEEYISDPWTAGDIYSVDHEYPASSKTDQRIVLYGQLGSSGFTNLHVKLKSLADSGRITYILRHYVKERSDKKLRLSGYGVELQMKSTEYKATDDSDIKDSTGRESDDVNEGVEEIDGINFGILKDHYPDKKGLLETIQEHLLETSNEVGALKVWQFQELSHQAAERIMKAPPLESIKVFTDIAQNFPMQAKSLIRTQVSSKMKKEMKRNQEIFLRNLQIQPTDTALFINGLYFDLDAVDILGLLEALRTELKVMEALHKIGFSHKIMDQLLALDLSGNMNNQEFAINFNHPAIIWTNNLEEESCYKRWPRSLNSLLRPTFPGVLRNICRNMYNLIIILDPQSANFHHYINIVESLHANSIPVRVGLAFDINIDNTSVTGLTNAGVAVHNAYQHFSKTKGVKKAISLLSTLSKYPENGKIDVSTVKKFIRNFDQSANVEDILSETKYNSNHSATRDFIKRTGFKTFPQSLLNGVPLPIAQDAESFEDTVFSAIMMQTLVLQKAVYKGEVVDDDNIVDFLTSQPHVIERLNQRILKTEKNQWLDLIGTVPNHEDIASWSARDTAAWLMDNMQYLYMSGQEDFTHLFTYWLVVDLHNATSRKLLREALITLESNGDIRIGVIINRAASTKNDVNSIVLAALASLPAEKRNSYIQNLIDEENVLSINEETFDFQEPAVMAKFNDQEFTLLVHEHYVKSALKLAPAEQVVICNGRVLGPLEDGEEFDRDDFALLKQFSEIVYGEKLAKKLDEIKTMVDDKKYITTDDVIMQIASLLVPRPQTRSRYNVTFSDDKHSVINVPAANPKEVAFNLIAVVDPVSRGAQKLGAILDTLQQSLNCNIKIFLNCVDKNSDMPLKSFYRFVFDPEPQFSSDGQLIGASAKFTKLPTSSLLTQNIHAPENWLVEVVKSVYDLDNIKLDNVAMGVHSEFELEYLLLEGHCFEATMGNPPRGLQITLGTESQPVMVDTIVMANLGYFQLKANPGEWLLRLRQGRSADIYDIVSVEGQDVVQKNNEVKVLMSSLKSHVLKMKVMKKPDKLTVDLLAEDDEKSGIWNSISRTFSSDDGKEQEEKINIFSLASGHLYERFIKIMMLSVIKNTKSPVKFWFLKNYLSPTLKDFLPHMAKEYGFEYELIQYKWPRWLHQQTEKQRTIWGYKILFLDVLFPLDVKKIIFVDADQVVKADLKELVELDLEGAPYAYTPFCDSRKEMDGFRFWKQGYWRTHLQGRSYHISALYVVDLKRFRRIAAGDRLRGQYQALSPDPNSLANLDQDLPNNMIHQVAIKTLPQEWLWCETWCSDQSKKTAKTIDLCNNPMTKEAKLQAAIRIVPEWVDYDEEIKTLHQRIEDESILIEKEDKDDSGELSKHEEL